MAEMSDAVRRSELYKVQTQLQSIWERIEYLEAKLGYSMDYINRHWMRFEQLEVKERTLLRPGTLTLQAMKRR